MGFSHDVGCLYLHGFLSSPASEKAVELQRFYQQHLTPEQVSIPELPFEPAHAMALAQHCLTELQSRYQRVFIIGSSLGGFYATWLSQQLDIPAVLVNPAVNPHGLFRHYLGPNQHFYSGETHILEERHLEQLAHLATESITRPENVLLLLQTGDETLDYRHAARLYRHCPGWLESGGNHRFNGFTERLPEMIQFAEYWSPAK